MADKIEFRKYVKAAEDILSELSQGGLVKSGKDESDAISFICDIHSKKKIKKNLFVTLKCIRGKTLDITFHCICDTGLQLSSDTGQKLAHELSKRYRYAKAYVKQGADKNGNKEYFFIGEYDFLMFLDDLDKYEEEFAEITCLLFSIMGDFIDLVHEAFGKLDDNLKRTVCTEELNVKINPNPF